MEKISIPLKIKNDLSELTDRVLGNQAARLLIRELAITEKELDMPTLVNLERAADSAQCANCGSINNCEQGKMEVVAKREQGKLVFRETMCRRLKLQMKMQTNLVYDNFTPTGIESDQQSLVMATSWLETRFLRTSPETLSKYNTHFHAALTALTDKATVAYVDFPLFVAQMGALQFSEPQEVVDTIARLVDAKYVVITNLGHQNATAFARDQLLFPILSGRLGRAVVTVLISIYPPEKQLASWIATKETYDDVRVKRIVDLIKQFPIKI